MKFGAKLDLEDIGREHPQLFAEYQYMLTSQENTYEDEIAGEVWTL